jgi:hypothetical protein
LQRSLPQAMERRLDRNPGYLLRREQYVKQEDGSRVTDGNDVRTIAELQAKLQTTEAELERAKTQRDYALRLLRQQQTLSTPRIQNKAYAFYMEQDRALAKLLSRIPRRVKDIFPLRLKQFVRNIVIKIG